MLSWVYKELFFRCMFLSSNTVVGIAAKFAAKNVVTFTNLVALNLRLKFSPLWMIGLKHISVWSESIPANRYFFESRAASRLSAIFECFTRCVENEEIKT